MAESDKPDSSTIKVKSKSSFLDEDLSNDFLSSWKSTVTGGDDMDFNFEPVAKGKNKAFDFGMDMDFSLDDAFGKTSFKLDMPDIDFSISPKKSPKSKEKNSEGESTEGSRQEKNGKFDLSFDFNGSKEIAFIEVFGKIPSLELDKPNSDRCGPSKKPSKFNKKLAEEGSDKGNCQEKIVKLSSPPRLTVKLDAAPISEEDKVVGGGETLGEDNFTLDTAASSAANIFKSMNSEVASNTEIQRSGFEDSPAPADSKPTQANPISMQNQVSGANNFSMVRDTNDGAGMKLNIAKSKKTGSMPVGASESGYSQLIHIL